MKYKELKKHNKRLERALSVANGVVCKQIDEIAMLNNNTGVNILPIRSINFPGDIAKQYAIAKKTTLNINKAKDSEIPSPKNGRTPTSKATVPVRGKANKGPMDRYRATAKNTPNQGVTREAKCCTSRAPV